MSETENTIENPIVTAQCPNCKAIVYGCVERYMTKEDKTDALNLHLAGYDVQKTDGPVKVSKCSCEVTA
jgi:hypothetical protein